MNFIFNVPDSTIDDPAEFNRLVQTMQTVDPNFSEKNLTFVNNDLSTFFTLHDFDFVAELFQEELDLLIPERPELKSLYDVTVNRYEDLTFENRCYLMQIAVMYYDAHDDLLTEIPESLLLEIVNNPDLTTKVLPPDEV